MRRAPADRRSEPPGRFHLQASGPSEASARASQNGCGVPAAASAANRADCVRAAANSRRARGGRRSPAPRRASPACASAVCMTIAASQPDDKRLLHAKRRQRIDERRGIADEQEPAAGVPMRVVQRRVGAPRSIDQRRRPERLGERAGLGELGEVDVASARPAFEFGTQDRPSRSRSARARRSGPTRPNRPSYDATSVWVVSQPGHSRARQTPASAIVRCGDATRRRPVRAMTPDRPEQSRTNAASIRSITPSVSMTTVAARPSPASVPAGSHFRHRGRDPYESRRPMRPPAHATGDRIARGPPGSPPRRRETSRREQPRAPHQTVLPRQG